MNIHEIAAQLKTTGYIVLDNPLQVSLSALLLARCQDDDSMRFQAAQIGRGLAKRQIQAIRGDVISWLEDADSTDQAYLAWMEVLRSGLNEALFLGLFDFECHYAIYGAGALFSAVLCIGVGLLPVVLIVLALAILDAIRKRVDRG